jgi:hypothetical protein
MKYLASILTLTCLTSLACNGTETQNPAVNPGGPLVSFGNSGCKKEVLANASRSTQAIVSGDAGVISYGDEVAGLKCFAWQVTGTDRVKVSMINFEDACGAQWQGNAAIESTGKLDLSLVNPQCLIALCGSCIYDWSFEVKGVDISQNLPVTATVDTCPGQQEIKTTSVELPLGTESSGILCRYADFNALGWQAMSLGTCGSVGMPCTGTSMCSTTANPDAQTCQGDLTCTDNGDVTQMICAQSCTLDSDCGTTGAQSCQTGLCRPKTAW